ncbi:2-oxoglutarate dehydrogenase complex dihydrolipoyllysine-residue succinyltransferase [candidate division KSB1 bacterium]|nr:MAG: 2-oxoglutarate dehydrogenase complex dihydrolipoyllysine-residue succinyltransferase [candidate division KSB1 bacterium]
MVAEVLIPSPGESVSEVTLAAWLKADGDYVRKDEELFEIESEKATLAVSANFSGAVSIKIKEGETARVGAVACTIDTEAAPPVTISAAEPRAESASGEPMQEETSAAIASPAAQKMMDERGITAEQIVGTGKDGRITKTDVLTHQQPVAPNPEPAPIAEAPTLMANARSTRRFKMSALRLKVSERLVASKNRTAMLTTFNEVDMSAIIAARAKYKELFKETHSASLGFMSFFVKAVVEGVRLFPAVNAVIEGDEIVYHDYVDMGIAVSAPKGLVVPVIRNAESLSFDRIEAEIERLAARARGNQLTLDEMSGGTFTISNGGVFGSLLSTPILNPPQSGILGMHNIVKRPIAVGDEVQIRPMMYLAFSYDHRIIDGRESVGFLVRVKECLEDPMRLLLKV